MLRTALIPAAAAVMLLAGCATGLPATPPATWADLEPLVEATADATLKSFDQSWVVGDAAEPLDCWYRSDGEGEWVRDDSRVVQVFTATSGYAEASLGKPSEVPVPTPSSFVAIWADVPGLEAATDDAAFDGRGGATATLLGSPDVAIAGGFDGDAWRVTIRVNCTTPGFAETPPAGHS